MKFSKENVSFKVTCHYHLHVVSYSYAREHVTNLRHNLAAEQEPHLQFSHNTSGAG